MKVTILALNIAWTSAARLPKALRAAGFDVYVCCFKNSIIANSRYANGFACLDQPATINSVWLGLRLIHEQWHPDIIIPGDDTSMELLHAFALHDESKRDVLDREIMALIRASLGEPAQFRAVECKSALTALGTDPTLVFPSQAAVHEQDNLFEVAERVGYPLVIKRDHSAGGTGVSIVRTAADLETHVATSGLFSTIGPGRANPVAGTSFLIQSYVEGWNASVSFAAVRGDMVASFAYQKLCNSGLGPTSVAMLIDRTDLTRQAAGIVRRFGFTGLGGVDFMVDARDGVGKIIEFNPRPTITTHLGAVFGCDLCAALRSALTGAPVPPLAAPRHTAVALFPGEWQRDPDSPYLETAYHDVPWDEPFLTKAMLTVIDSLDQPLFVSLECADPRHDPRQAVASLALVGA